jgi:ABC-type transporter Mla subunit MlaD
MATKFLTTEGLEHFKKHLDKNWATIDALDDTATSINNALNSTRITINDKISPLEDNIKMLKNRVTALECELFGKEKEQKIYKSKKRISVHIKL